MCKVMDVHVCGCYIYEWLLNKYKLKGILPLSVIFSFIFP